MYSSFKASPTKLGTLWGVKKRQTFTVSWPPTECADLVLLDFSTLLQLPHLWQYIQAIGAIGLWCLNKRDLENNIKVAPNTPNTRGGTWLMKWLNDQFPSLVAIMVRTSEPNDLAPTELSSASPTTLKDADKSAGGPTFSKLLKKVSQVFHIRCLGFA